MDRECYLGKHRYGAESDLHTDSIETPSFITYSMELPHDPRIHGLRTPNEGINQRYLKNWADVADKICCRHT